MKRSVSWESKPLPPLIGGGLVVVVGLAIATAGWLWRERLTSFLANAAHAQGTIVAMERGSNSNSHFPVFTFKDTEGHSYEIRSSYSSNDFRVGDKVDVSYDDASPYDAVLTAVASPSGFPLFVIGFGLVFVAGGISIGWTQYRYEGKRRDVRPAS